MAANDLIACPGGCGRQVHRRAGECPNCGYRADAADFEDLLGSLSTVSSILVGFGLAALVALATDESHALDGRAVSVAAGCWVGSSVVLGFVLVLAELLRRRAAGLSRIQLPEAEDRRLWGRSVWLLTMFAGALLSTATGVVLVAFHFSVAHGLIGLAAAAGGLATVVYVLR